MKINTVSVAYRPQMNHYSIRVNGEQLNFKFDLPDDLPENVRDIYLDSSDATDIYYTTQENYPNEIAVQNTPENYALWIQPFVNLWLAEKDRIEQEQIEAEQEFVKLENRKERALAVVENDYDSVLSRGFVRTSLGFDADITPASVATLLGTQVGLAYTARTLKDGEIPKTVFRDFYGLKRELDAVQVELLICQINGAQNYIRELKYEFKGAVKGSYTNEDLNKIISECTYSTLDYSKLSEDGKPTVLPFVETQSIKDRIDAFKR